MVGNRVETRGKAKYLGGVGTKITGISRRQFKPNLQRARVEDAPGRGGRGAGGRRRRGPDHRARGRAGTA